MAKLNLTYFGGENLYSDGDVEEEILEIAKSGHSMDELSSVSFPVLYHLSKVRENILNWYPFKPESRILEIGSGCGAITGLLCERAKTVVSVELSKRRADINYARHKDFDNLEIMVGNLNDMEFGKPFDYVILNGVFEYAMSFTKGNNPYEDFLTFIAGNLKPEGRILVAIENRLGLKYFAGAPEDHTDAYFDGLNEYENNQSVRTFSKNEWIQMMQNCGMKSWQFYYPYPDYKFPKEIFTDSSLKEEEYGRHAWNFTNYRITLFNEEKVAASLIQEGIMDRFVNSFLIEMSKEEMEDAGRIIYAKLSRDRAEQFAIATVIEQVGEEKRAVKYPLSGKAVRHLETICSNSRSKEEGEIRNLPGVMAGKGVAFPFLTGENLGHLTGRYIRKKRVDKVRELVRMVYDTCLAKEEKPANYHTEAFTEIFGPEKLGEKLPCVCPANIDLILDNIFPAEEGFRLIDCEWVFDFTIPSSFIIWRTINEIYASYPKFGMIFQAEDFYREYGITPQMSRVFREWATYFAEEYVKANRILPYTKSEMWFNLADVRTGWKRKNTMFGSIYVDTGMGFSENQKIPVEALLSNEEFSIDVSLEHYTGICNLRFDPIEGEPCICRIHKCPDSNVRLIAENARETSEGDVFLNIDPIYRIVWEGEAPKRLSFSGMFRKMSVQEAMDGISKTPYNRGGKTAQETKGHKGLKFWRK